MIIVGGGVVGTALARAVRRTCPTLRLALIEAGPGRPETVKEDAPPQPRSYALSPASLQLLGVSPPPNNTSTATTSKDPLQSRVGYYSSMQVWEAQQPASLLFQASDRASYRHRHGKPASSNNNTNNPQLVLTNDDYLGAVVEDWVLVDALWQQCVNDTEQLVVYPHTTIAHVETPENAASDLVRVTLQPSSSSITNTTAPPTVLSTHLLIAADGARSRIRSAVGIDMTGFSYAPEQAWTCTVRLEQPHQQRAFQRFFNRGILALLPTFDPYASIVVWSTTTPPAMHTGNHDTHATQSPEQVQIVHQLNSYLQTGPERIPPLFHPNNNSSPPLPLSRLWDNLMYGVDKVLETIQYGPAMMAQEHQGQCVAPPRITSMASKPMTFPLSCTQAQRYHHHRVVLVGDAAHTMHPMAGQGLNVGLSDVASLVRTIQRAVEAGMDPATLLDDYERDRRAHVSQTLVGLHTLHTLFAAGRSDRLLSWLPQPALLHAKALGMNAVQNIRPLREQLVHVACGEGTGVWTCCGMVW
jgi:ubiquinone biosynthesis monooxygenase Coq6